jgi:hypothetical protein
MFSLKGLAAAFEPARKINWLGEDLRAGFGAYISSVLLHWGERPPGGMPHSSKSLISSFQRIIYVYISPENK